MKIVLDNKSYHDARVTIEGKTYNLRPQQIVYVDVYNTEPLNVKIEHKYISYIDCRNDYIMVITSEYNMYGVTDGAILSIAHDRSKFSNNGVYERFFVSFPLMYSCTENHTVTNFEELYKPFKKYRKWDIISDSIIDIVFDFANTTPFLGLGFIVVWIAEGLKTALLALLALFLIDIVGVFIFYIVAENLWRKAEDSSRRRKRRKGRNVEENLFIEDLKGVCESTAISAYYADPYRNVIAVGSNYEG